MLLRILENQAANFSLGPAQFFLFAVKQADWAPQIQSQWLNPTGVPSVDFPKLVDFALNQKGNPKDPRFSTLGSLLQPLLPLLSLEDSRAVAVLIIAYNLYLDPQLIGDLALGYTIPLPAARQGGDIECGPVFVWRGPADDLELQSWLPRPPDFQDVGFLMRGLERASGVCRIELEDGRTASGFLVAPDLLLTNYHVFKLRPDDDLATNLAGATFRFGCISGKDALETVGHPVRAAAGMPIAASPVEGHDFVLLRLDPAVQAIEGIRPLPFDPQPAAPAPRTGLHVLQHPEGKPLMLALSPSGVTGSFPATGLFQYVTSTAGGSSGAPCLDDQWNVVGIHHAERSRLFGSVREGILLQNILPQIIGHLPH